MENINLNNLAIFLIIGFRIWEFCVFMSSRSGSRSLRSVGNYLCVSFVLVPNEAELGVGCSAVVGPDVAVEKRTFHSNRLASQNMVLL